MPPWQAFFILYPMAEQTKKKKKHNRSLFYRISAWLHLWLGLFTGAIVVVVCLTACIWVFNDEIRRYITEPETRVEQQDKAVLTPGQIQTHALAAYPGRQMGYATYRQGATIDVHLNDISKDEKGGGKKKKRGKRGGSGVTLKMNPYTGAIIRADMRREGDTDFFRTILNGHRFLWLPYEIGRPIVNYSILIFLLIMITGLIMWFPRKWNKNTRDASFKVKWNAKFKRLNYDLHNVFGFYSLLFLLIIGTTGIVYGIEWFSKGLYWVSSAGTESLADYDKLTSDSTQAGKYYSPIESMDVAWNKALATYPDAQGFYYGYPDTADAKSTISMYIYPSTYSSYKSRALHFDRHTGKQLASTSPYDQEFATASFATKLRKMNYDIHVGSILGLPGKIMAFFAALIGATLPITGFLVWWGKKKKSKKPLPAAKAGTKLKAAQAKELTVATTNVD